MSRTLIEQEGIDIVRKYIRKNGFMVPYLDENDKTPMWDGEIFVYKKNIRNIDESSDFFDYKVSVQVKAHQLKNNEDFPSEAYYRLPIYVINSYKANGGLVFFYVYIKDDNNSQIYCSYLTKNKLTRLLENNKGSKSASIKLDKITTNQGDFRRQLRFVNIQKTRNQVDLQTCDLRNFKSFTLIVDTEDDNEDKMLSLVQHNVNILVNYEGINEGLYMFDGPASVELQQLKDLKVSINGKIFFNSFSRKLKKDGQYFLFGKSTYMRLPLTNQDNVKIDFKFEIKSTTVDEVINDLDFIISLVEEKRVCIGKGYFELDGLTTQSSPLLLFKEQLQFWKNVKKLKSILHIRGDINPTLLSKNDYDDLNVLIDSFIFNKPIYNPNAEERPYLIETCGLRIYFYTKRISEDKFKLLDIYQSLFSRYIDVNGIERFSPPYSFIFCLEELPSNLYLDNIVKDYENFRKYNDKVSSRANDDLLNLLNHFDRTNDPYILDAAVKLSQWLKKQKTSDKVEKIIYKLNYYQTIKRKNGSLNADEAEELVKMKIQDDLCNYGRYLLLDNKSKSLYFFNKLPDDQKESLKTMPIFHFM